MAILRAIVASTLLLVALTVDSTVAVQCGISHASNSRIVGGRYATPHAYPWIVFIQSEYQAENEGDPNLFAACDGSLIDDQWLVTAAHCFGPQPGYQLHRVALVLGAHNLANKTEHRYVVAPKHIYRHANYVDGHAGSKYDITMVQLPQKIDFSKTAGIIAPICLPENGQTVSKSECNAIGWGKTGASSPSSPILKVVDHNLLDAAECERKRPEVSDLQVCAGYLEHGVCQGDSGGPLQCRNSAGAYVLCGITSYGDKQCGGSAPAVFTNVQKYLTWIHSVKSKDN